MRERIKHTSFNYPHFFTFKDIAHTLSFPLQFCSLPFTATLFSHSFPNLSKNLRRSCAFIALWYKVGVASRRKKS